MSSLSAYMTYRFHPFTSINSAWRQWRWRQTRAFCEHCAINGTNLDAESLRLLNAGHYRAAVFISRLRLETELSELAAGLPEKGDRFGGFWFPLLVKHCRLTSRQANRASAVYCRASRVVHGGACSPGRAKGIVADVRQVIRSLNSPAVMTESSAD